MGEKEKGSICKSPMNVRLLLEPVSPCIRHPSNPEDRGLGPAEAIVLVCAQMQVYTQAGPTIFGRLLIKDFLLFNIPHIAGASLHLLCVVFLKIIFISLALTSLNFGFCFVWIGISVPGKVGFSTVLSL